MGYYYLLHPRQRTPREIVEEEAAAMHAAAQAGPPAPEVNCPCLVLDGEEVSPVDSFEFVTEPPQLFPPKRDIPLRIIEGISRVWLCNLARPLTADEGVRFVEMRGFYAKGILTKAALVAWAQKLTDPS